VAVLISSVVFAGFHYLDIFGEEFLRSTFVFRCVSGLVLAALFLIRGVGVTVYTHSFYNLFLMFRA